MTKEEKEQIKNLRKQGYGSKRIAKELSLNPNTVKSYIYRLEKDSPRKVCKQCGKPLLHSKRKSDCFCSKKCSKAWWSHHRYDNPSDKVIEHECQHCHQIFLALASSKRKYCSRACYLEERFGAE